MKDWWKVILKMALPLVKAAGEAKRNEDENDTGKDDLIGFVLVFISDLGTAVISGDANKIKETLSKASNAPHN